MADLDALADALFDAFEAGDVSTLDEIVAPGARFWNPFLDRSWEEVRAVMTPGIPLQPQLRYDERRRCLLGDGTGFVQQHVARMVGPRATLALVACVVGRVDGDGRLARLDMYYDTAPVVAAGLGPDRDS